MFTFRADVSTGDTHPDVVLLHLHLVTRTGSNTGAVIHHKVVWRRPEWNVFKILKYPRQHPRQVVTFSLYTKPSRTHSRARTPTKIHIISSFISFTFYSITPCFCLTHVGISRHRTLRTCIWLWDCAPVGRSLGCRWKVEDTESHKLRCHWSSYKPTSKNTITHDQEVKGHWV